MRTPILLSLFLSLAPAVAAAGKAAPPSVSPAPMQLSEHDVHQVVRAAAKQRGERLQFTSRFFAKITQLKDYRGEHVLRSNGKITAFLDMSDPRHPRFDPRIEDEDPSVQSIPVARRAHILVVPNTQRAHIGQEVSGVITLADLDATREVMAEAHKLAVDLKIKNPRIYINTSDRIGVGYLHVHVVGEHDGSPYPQLLQP